LASKVNANSRQNGVPKRAVRAIDLKPDNR
jgi:hypothetical protein